MDCSCMGAVPKLGLRSSRISDFGGGGLLSLRSPVQGHPWCYYILQMITLVGVRILSADGRTRARVSSHSE